MNFIVHVHHLKWILRKRKPCVRKPLNVIWTESVNVLGIVFSYNGKLANNRNFEDEITSLKPTFALWKNRDLNSRGKLGNGEHLSLKAYKYEENNIYVIIIKQHKEHIKFYPETHFYRHNFSRYEVMAYKRRWRRSAITCIAGGNCERIL